jgi:hypothetical protein
MKSKIVNKIRDKGFPYHSKEYHSAHEEASKAEKKKYPNGYKKLEKLEKHLSKNELMATNKKSGKIEVEKKYKKYRHELEYHEKEEHKNIKRIAKKKTK